MNVEPLVFIILVNWNGKTVTLECLESLKNVTYKARKTLVVDNASTDGSAEAISGGFPDVSLLRMTSNLRFAGGNNAGMRLALEQGAEMVLLLNNDTTVAPDFLAHMVSRMHSTAHAGMVAPKIYYHAHPTRIWYAGGRISMWTGSMSHTGIRQEDRGQFDVATETSYATGCCILASKDLIQRVGMLDESFHIYGEDADWSMRARKEGYKIVYEPRARIWHKISVTSGGHLSRFKLTNKLISNFRFFARHASWYHWLVFPWMSLLVNGIAAARYVASPQKGR